MFASQPPAVVQPGSNDDQSDVIEVVGNRPDQVQKIDRRSYQVKETPHAAQQDTLQLLRGLPAVTISPDDEVMLLGAGNVTIMVDGRPLHVLDVAQYLRTLHGSDIERIEIITNPSAQYSALGTGGIINIVLKRKQKNGVSGTASAEASSFGRGQVNGTVKSKQGRWTFDLQAEGDDGRTDYNTNHILRTIESAGGGTPTVNTEDEKETGRVIFGYVNAKIGYDLDPKTSVSLQGFGGASYNWTTADTDFRGLTPDFQSFSEHQAARSTVSFVGADLALDHKGAKQGETLKASLHIFGNPEIALRNRMDLGDGGALSSDRRDGSLFAAARADWEHPIGKKEILSLGAHWNVQDTDRHYTFTGSGDPSLDFSTMDSYRGVERTGAVYATFQQAIGSWTIMPGLRLEQNSRRISSPGRPDVRIDRTDLFPTFHAEHHFGAAVALTLSYSRRIDRPGLDQLRPYRVVTDPLSVSQGNPDLRDQSTDAYEANLHYHRRKLDVGLILYDRETHDLWSQAYSVDADGIEVGTTVNAGRKTDRGAELDVGTPLLRRVKVTTSINLFDSRVPTDPVAGSASAETVRFTTNSTLEWDGPDRHGRPGDIAQLQIYYNSPERSFESRSGAFFLPTFSYTHSLTRKLAVTATVQGYGPLHNYYDVRAPLLQQHTDSRQRLPEFRLKLVKSFGGS
ncbi:MAG TPA: TonB-dependent receptor [Allosphingosinicella sp.]|jgi:outer membrane receptor for ferrienterochelin and colicin|nr:TonB-dependent receptor [Allosphingosinicella sp.]